MKIYLFYSFFFITKLSRVFLYVYLFCIMKLIKKFLNEGSEVQISLNSSFFIFYFLIFNHFILILYFYLYDISFSCFHVFFFIFYFLCFSIFTALFFFFICDFVYFIPIIINTLFAPYFTFFFIYLF